MGENNMDKKQSAQIIKWKKQSVRRFEFYLNKEKDGNLIEFLENKSNRQEYFRDLVDKDYKKQGLDK